MNGVRGRMKDGDSDFKNTIVTLRILQDFYKNATWKLQLTNHYKGLQLLKYIILSLICSNSGDIHVFFLFIFFSYVDLSITSN